MSLPIALPDDLLSQRTITPTDCWEWNGRRDSNGYWHGRKLRVHRLVTHLVHGLDLDNPREYARHCCDNPPCFNPDHLQPGTPTENQQDAIRRARRIRSACKRGHPCRTCDNNRQRQWEERQRAKGAIPWGQRPATCPYCGHDTTNGYLKDHVRRMHPGPVT